MGMIGELFAISAAQTAEVTANPAGIHALLESLDGTPNHVSLEKSWHGLHYVFTQNAWEGAPPLNFLASGGDPIGDEDCGYGPARLVRNNDVRALDAALDAFTAEEFDRRFDLRGMEAAQIYPQIWDEPREELLEEYGDYFSQLRALVQQAARTDQALLVAIR